ncbi:hypothetical protein UFOVP972_325 [uncultured Caudovirales phage]|jgi:hypothetical protein|uniref:Lipoprotein n=1 Tax=uncultured Caudovirales phage TaxID=2100421 RepID=A0A6J5PYN6_9CAUD|nr:hypothetical protein UFOVP972_325 [uncultured Caudovirales phage]
MKILIILFALIIASCGTYKSINHQSDSLVMLTWKKSNHTFDVYLKGSIIIYQIPCEGTNHVYLHNYRAGNYLFVFKKDGKITEKKKITIYSQNHNNETSSVYKR